MTSQGSKIAAWIDECGDVDALPDELRIAAARLVCANAQGDTQEQQVADARDLMGALGLLPGQESEWLISSPIAPNQSMA